MKRGREKNGNGKVCRRGVDKNREKEEGKKRGKD